MTAVSKNVYIDQLDDVVNQYNNTYHRVIKMNPTEVKDNTYIHYIKEVNDKDPKYKVGDHDRISKQKNIFGKGYTPNCSKKNLCLKKFKILFYVHILLMIAMVKTLFKHFIEKKHKKQMNKDLGQNESLKK